MVIYTCLLNLFPNFAACELPNWANKLHENSDSAATAGQQVILFIISPTGRHMPFTCLPVWKLMPAPAEPCLMPTMRANDLDMAATKIITDGEQSFTCCAASSQSSASHVTVKTRAAALVLTMPSYGTGSCKSTLMEGTQHPPRTSCQML